MEENRVPFPTIDDVQYSSYLLRLWREEPGGEQRALLQDILSGERRHFSNLADLLTFLQGERSEFTKQEVSR